MKKLSAYILFCLAAVVLASFTGSALALEGSYPVVNVPGGGNINLANSNYQNFPGFIAYIFYFAIAIAGILGVIIIAIAGFEYMVSAGNAGLMSDAKDRAKSALIGIALLFLSFIIIQTINPDLINLRTAPGEGNPLPQDPLIAAQPPAAPAGGGGLPSAPSGTNFAGIPYALAQDDGFYDCANFNDTDACYLFDGKEYTIADPQVPNLSDKGIIDRSNAWFLNNSPDPITLHVYYRTGFGEDPSIPSQTIELASKGVISLTDVQSLQWKKRPPGIYFYTEQGCPENSNSMYDGITNTQTIPTDFQDAKSVKIINDAKQGLWFGFILDATDGGRSTCSAPMINPEDHSICLSVPGGFIPKYIGVFNWDKGYTDIRNEQKRNNQSGVSLYGMPVPAEEPTDGSVERLQNYYNIAADRVINQYYYVPSGNKGEGYYHQKYYNISTKEIIDQIEANRRTQNWKAYYECPTDPGFLLKDGTCFGAGGSGGSGGGGDVCEPDDPAGDGNTACLTGNGIDCVQSIQSRGNYLYVLYEENEKGQNRTCSMFIDDILDLQQLLPNGKSLFRMDIIPVR